MTAPKVLLSVLVSILFCVSHSIAKTPSTPRPRALVLPVTKDQSTKQYVTQINQGTPFVPTKLVVDLGGESLWVDCQDGYVSSSYKPVHCRSSLCSLLKTDEGCVESCNGGKTLGCHNHTCRIWPENSVSLSITVGDILKDVVSLLSTDGSNPGPVVAVPRFVFTCAWSRILKGLPEGVKGMAGLGRTPIALHSQISHAFRFPRKFAICLSSYGTGVIFFGDGPYVMLPGIDISQHLTYTPLITNRIGAPWTKNIMGNDPSSDYFIRVKGIKINGKQVPINKRLLKLDKRGKGGTKISNVIPYTRLETSIYNAVTNAFIESLSGVPRVTPVAPFKAFYKSSDLSSTRLGPGVPPIDLVLQNNAIWTFYGANTMVSGEGGISCLAFVEGDSFYDTPIVIGGHQLENAILQFDLAKSRLGFVSTLLGMRTTCANFNFTSTA